ncbi:MAG: DUF2993 domain-containing protein [Actinomycetota bacterium]|nr:DUF2993 domain-containing protein [Actinomycetota bacterium]
MRKLLVFLVILVVIIVGLDFAGRAIAESKTGEALAKQGAISPAPNVDIHGLSFLWQAIDGNYSHVTLTATDLSTGKLTGIGAVADLFDVALPLSDALSGKVDKLTAGQANIRASIPPAALSTVLGQQNLTVAAGSNGALRLGTNIAAGGQSFAVQVDVKPSVSNGVLHLAAGKVVNAPAALPAALATTLVKGLSIDLPLTGLPFPIESATATVEGGSLIVTAQTGAVKIGELIKAAG